MILKSNCEGWKLKFEHDSEVELSEELKVALSDILHAAGDSVSLVCDLPESATELQAPIAESIKGIFLGVANHVEDMVGNFLTTHMMKQPLTQEFSEESVFGMDLWGTLEACTINEEELNIIKEFTEEQDEQN